MTSIHFAATLLQQEQQQGLAEARKPHRGHTRSRSHGDIAKQSTVPGKASTLLPHIEGTDCSFIIPLDRLKDLCSRPLPLSDALASPDHELDTSDASDDAMSACSVSSVSSSPRSPVFGSSVEQLAVDRALSRPLRWRLHWLSVPSVPMRDQSLHAAQLVSALSSNDWKILKHLIQIDSFLTQSTSKWITMLLSASHKAESFVLDSVASEIPEQQNAAMLFRGNSGATRLVSSLFGLKGQDFLHGVLTAPIHTLCNAPVDASQTQAQIHDACQLICDLLAENLLKLPKCLVFLLRHLFHLIEEKFPGHGIVAIRSFVFLRFLCPAVVSPQSFQLLNKKPTAAQQLSLVSLARLLQCLVNSACLTVESKRTMSTSSRLSSPATLSFIEANAAAICDVVDKILSIDLEQFAIPCCSIRNDEAVLWLCDNCTHVNLRSHEDCAACNVSPPFPERLDCNINSLDQAAVNLAHNIFKHLGDLVDHVPPDLTTFTLQYSEKELFLVASAAFRGSARSALAVGSHAPTLPGTPTHRRKPLHCVPSDNGKFDEALTKDDTSILHAAIQLPEVRNDSTFLHGVVVVLVCRGCAARFILNQVNALLSDLFSPIIAPVALKHWNTYHELTSPYAPLEAFNVLCRAYVRTVMTSNGRHLLRGLIRQLQWHDATVPADELREAGASYTRRLFTTHASTLVQMWAPGVLRIALELWNAVRQIDATLAPYFLAGLLSRCVLSAILEPRMYGAGASLARLAAKDVQLVWASACDALVPDLLVPWVKQAAASLSTGATVAFHETESFASRPGCVRALTIAREHCRVKLLSVFDELSPVLSTSPRHREVIHYHPLDPLLVVLPTICETHAPSLSGTSTPADDGPWAEVGYWGATEVPTVSEGNQIATTSSTSTTTAKSFSSGASSLSSSSWAATHSSHEDQATDTDLQPSPNSTPIPPRRHFPPSARVTGACA
eukprot:m.36875 g.36875  ORF g.36875 m.36875 type:complete len:955 (+) comp10048_c0_seq1:276-3140(+)